MNDNNNIEFDTNYRPQDDLFRYVNGKWIEKTPIPDDKTRFGSFDILNEQSLEEVRIILEDESALPVAPNAYNLYNSYMNYDGTKKAVSFEKLRSEVAEIEANTDIEALFTYQKDKFEPLGKTLFASMVTADIDDPEMNIIHFAQTGITLDEEQYREPKHAHIVDAYRNLIMKVLQILNISDAENRADEVIAYEREVATLHKSNADLRDVNATHNPMTLGEIDKIAPKLGILDYYKDFLADSTVDVSNVEFYQKYGDFLTDTNLRALQTKLIIWRAGEKQEATTELDDAFFEYSKLLTGVDKRPDVWKRAVNFASIAGDEIAEIYVSKKFTPEAKLKMNLLVANLIEAYRISIKNVTWMQDETKEKALLKLSKFVTEIGYPKVYHDYSKLVTSNDYDENIDNAKRFAVQKSFDEAYQKIDRRLWHMFPQTVNAYYNPTDNVIVFPAAILQPPFFGFAQTDPQNYGGIGAVIGHEIGHGFDDQGSEFDGDGKKIDWWTAEDKAAFKKLTDKLNAQYAQFTPFDLKDEADEYKVNGELTTGENVGDLSGLKIALLALALSKGHQSIDDFITADPGAIREFFINFALIWRGKGRKEFQKLLLTLDPHSPGEFRANIVRNLDAFHQVFDTKPGDGLYLAPDERVDIW